MAPTSCLSSLQASLLTCQPVCEVWGRPISHCLGPAPSGRPTSLGHISGPLRRHALSKQIIEKITPGWDSRTADLSHVSPSSGFLLEIEEWLPNLSLVAAFHLHESCTPHPTCGGSQGASSSGCDPAGVGDLASLAFTLPLSPPSPCTSQLLLLSLLPSLPRLLSVLGALSEVLVGTTTVIKWNPPWNPSILQGPGRKSLSVRPTLVLLSHPEAPRPPAPPPPPTCCRSSCGSLCHLAAAEPLPSPGGRALRGGRAQGVGGRLAGPEVVGVLGQQEDQLR